MWKKLLINAGLSSIATICERTIHQVCNDEDLRTLSIRTMSELLAVGKAIGLSAEADPEAMTNPEKAPHHVPSFLQDLRAGRPFEIQNGILAARAIAGCAGVDTPSLDAVAALMKARSPVPA